MKSIKFIKCTKCELELEILENFSQINENIEREKAFCPNCHSIIFEIATKSWLYVKKTEEKTTEDVLCEYPMP